MSGLSRLKKICRYASIVMNISAVILAVLAVTVAAIGIWSMSDASVSAGFYGDWLHLGDDADALMKTSACLQMVLILALGSFTVAMLGMIMVSIHREHSPFTDRNAARMKYMAVSYLVSSFLLMALGIMRGMNASEIIFLFLGTLLVSVVSYCLALMVRYGQLLQEESDMTL